MYINREFYQSGVTSLPLGVFSELANLQALYVSTKWKLSRSIGFTDQPRSEGDREKKTSCSKSGRRECERAMIRRGERKGEMRWTHGKRVK